MSFKVIPTSEFKKLFKKLYKKYPTLKKDLSEIIDTISEDPSTGIALGYNLYKIRMAISSKGKGKSAGARVITYVVTEDQEVYLVHIYDKSKLDNLSKDQILESLKKAGLI
ncbi:MAG: type II toxin-antitoxin system RelE/ParE family toxin [Fulvivirga sp.]|uniref:type II toxin-antitoxin system RelE/ParE family toxin n=1 Tax=Fulvivirga sp. TaxID=1931237 RepID=UPI0032EE0C6C